VSAAKRRIKRKIKMLVRLDLTHRGLYLLSSPKRDAACAEALWWRCIVPLGDALSRRLPDAWARMADTPARGIGLMEIYRKRKGGVV
jgi:hypothetical protein